MPDNTPEYHRAYYVRTREHQLKRAAERYAEEENHLQRDEKARAWRKRNREFLDDLKAKTPCADCGILHPPYVMDFDHLDGADKVTNIAKVARVWSIERLKTEIAKCEIVCSNCHRIRTHERKTMVLKPEEIVPNVQLQTSGGK